jgi:hypothetical protein
MRPYRLPPNWSINRLAKLVRFYASGKTWQECAFEFQTCGNTLRCIYYNTAEGRETRKRATVTRHWSTKFWTDARIKAVLLMRYKQGMSLQACADAVGRPGASMPRVIYGRRGQELSTKLGLQKLKQKPLDLTGRKFGKLTVIKRGDFRPYANGSGSYVWLCQCSCGRQRKVHPTNLTTGKSRSCGKHRATGKKAHRYKNGHWCKKLRGMRCAFGNMHRRCKDLNNENYGKRGIFVAPEWSNDAAGFERFLADMKIPDGKRPRGMSLDRKDVDGPYSAQNCKWSTDLEQANNKQVHKRARIALIGNDWFESSYDGSLPY